MKNQIACIEKLEKTCDMLKAKADEIPEDQEATPEQAVQMSFILGGLLALGWVLDQEDFIRELLLHHKATGIFQALEKGSVSP